jgi:hypothetical protein
MDRSQLDGVNAVDMSHIINPADMHLASLQHQQGGQQGGLSPGDSLPTYWMCGTADVCGQRSCKPSSRVGNQLIAATAAAMAPAFADDIRSDGQQSIVHRDELGHGARETGKIKAAKVSQCCSGESQVMRCASCIIHRLANDRRQIA